MTILPMKILATRHYDIGRAMRLVSGLLYLLKTDYTHLHFDTNERGHVFVPLRKSEGFPCA